MPPEFDKLLLEELSDAIIAKSSEGCVVYWSKGAERVFGYPAHEATGRMVLDLIIPPDRVEEEKEILQKVRISELSQYETTRRRKDGSLIYVDVSSKVVRDSEGGLRFILSSNKDVTRLKVLRDAKLAEARYANILESTPDGIIMANPAGHIVLANSHDLAVRPEVPQVVGRDGNIGSGLANPHSSHLNNTIRRKNRSGQSWQMIFDADRIEYRGKVGGVRGLGSGRTCPEPKIGERKEQ